MRSTYRPPAKPATMPRDEWEARAFTRGLLFGIGASSAFWVAATAALIVAVIR